MIKKKGLSIEDKKSWEDYIKNPSDIYDKDNKNSSKNKTKNRLRFDFHGFTLEDANKKVRELIFYCLENKYKEILLITGKGLHSTNDKDVYVSKKLGMLRFSIPEFIKTNNELNKLITSVEEADVKEGGEGAIVIKLKKL